MSIEQLEQLRKKIIKKTILTMIIGTILIAFLIPSFGIFIFLFGAIFSYSVSRIIIRKDVNLLSKEYKNIFVTTAIKQFFTDIQYDSMKGISENTISETAMLRMGNRYYSNDHIKAKYKDVIFESSDVLVQQENYDGDGNRQTFTYFRGQWMIFEFNKSFKSNIQVKSIGFINSKLEKGLFTSSKYHKVQLEDIEFNKMFEVYAKDDLEAFYILTTPIMEKIKELYGNQKSQLLFCFIDNKLHVAVQNNKDAFEPNIYKKINIEEAKASVNQDILNITKFIDILQLNNDIFKRD